MAQDDNLATTPQSTLRRRPDRGSRERTTVNAIIDEALVCHIGFVDEGAAVVIPATPWRIDGWLYLHGSASSRLIRHIASGAPVCVSVALVDGLVFARSAMRHSTDYRSVVLFGRGEQVDAPVEKAAALMRLIDKLSPGRAGMVRPPNDRELAVTGVVRLAITEGSAKVRSGAPTESDLDSTWNVWTGTVPVTMAAGTPVAGDSNAALPIPALPNWLRS